MQVSSCASAPFSSIGSAQVSSSFKNCAKAFLDVAKKVALVALPLLIGAGIGAAMLFAGLPLVMAVSVGVGAAGLGLLVLSIVSAIKKGKAQAQQASQQSPVEPQQPASSPFVSEGEESNPESSASLGLRRLFGEDGEVSSAYYTAQEEKHHYDVPNNKPYYDVPKHHYDVPSNKPYYDVPRKVVSSVGFACNCAADAARSPKGLVGHLLDWLLRWL